MTTKDERQERQERQERLEAERRRRHGERQAAPEKMTAMAVALGELVSALFIHGTGHGEPHLIGECKPIRGAYAALSAAVHDFGLALGLTSGAMTTGDEPPAVIPAGSLKAGDRISATARGGWTVTELTDLDATQVVPVPALEALASAWEDQAGKMKGLRPAAEVTRDVTIIAGSLEDCAAMLREAITRGGAG